MVMRQLGIKELMQTFTKLPDYHHLQLTRRELWLIKERFAGECILDWDDKGGCFIFNLNKSLAVRVGPDWWLRPVPGSGRLSEDGRFKSTDPSGWFLSADNHGGLPGAARP